MAAPGTVCVTPGSGGWRGSDNQRLRRHRRHRRHRDHHQRWTTRHPHLIAAQSPPSCSRGWRSEGEGDKGRVVGWGVGTKDGGGSPRIAGTARRRGGRGCTGSNRHDSFMPESFLVVVFLKVVAVEQDSNDNVGDDENGETTGGRWREMALGEKDAPPPRRSPRA